MSCNTRMCELDQNYQVVSISIVPKYAHIVGSNFIKPWRGKKESNSWACWAGPEMLVYTPMVHAVFCLLRYHSCRWSWVYECDFAYLCTTRQQLPSEGASIFPAAEPCKYELTEHPVSRLNRFPETGNGKSANMQQEMQWKLTNPESYGISAIPHHQRFASFLKSKYVQLHYVYNDHLCSCQYRAWPRKEMTRSSDCGSL